MSLNIFDVEIEPKKKAEIYQTIDLAITGAIEPLFIVTLNPEILLKAENDVNYKKILNQANLKIVDGFGIQLVSWLNGTERVYRVPGADLAEYILNLANKINLKIGLVMHGHGLSAIGDLQQAMQKRQIKNCDIYSVTRLDDLDSFIKIDTQILIVGLGAPNQERFIHDIKDKLPNLKIAIGVGGTFDYWTGRKKRAPIIMQKMGMEWLWRLAIQPNRIIRIWQAVVVFVYKNI